MSAVASSSSSEANPPILPLDLQMEIFSHVKNPLVVRSLCREMNEAVNLCPTFFYRPIYLQILAIEGVDLETFECERSIEGEWPFNLKVRRAWKCLNLYRKFCGLAPVEPIGNMVKVYEKGHAELQHALIPARVSLWIGLGGAVNLEAYTPQELGLALRKYLQENHDPDREELTLMQNMNRCVPPEFAFFRSLRTLYIHSLEASEEIITQFTRLKAEKILSLEHVHYHVMKMYHSFAV